MIEDKLRDAVGKALEAKQWGTADDVVLERPAVKDHGDWSTNVAMKLAKSQKRNPRELATELATHLTENPPEHVQKIDVAGAGFLNFTLGDGWLHDVLTEVVTQGEDDFARHAATGTQEKVMIEFVSANPTGPVHVGNGWFASYGDAVGRLLQRTGAQVHREYYVNDTGGQIDRLGASILARRQGMPVPEGGYPDGFVKGLASAYEGPEDQTEAGRWAAERILRYIRTQMERVNIHYDEWFSQASIEEGPAIEEAIAELDKKGLVFEEDGALWLNTAPFGDPREKRVLRRSPDNGGTYTYLAGDIAYHRNKFVTRGFDRVINVWGADHAGQVPSLKAAVEALGIDPTRLEVRLGQMVSLSSGRMGKRLGNAVDLDDVVEDIGPDATRLLSLISSPDQAVTLDLDQVRAETRESPVFYVQYAHARIASIQRVAEERGVERQPLDDVDLAVLTHERELDLLRTLSKLPLVIKIAADERAPHKVTHWVRELADRFHGFYHDCYVMGEDVPAELTQARLWLVESTRIGLRIALHVLGAEAPERM